MNRAPSANDYWWAEHQKSCGGTFTKVREPDNSSKKCKKKDDQAKILDDGSRVYLLLFTNYVTKFCKAK